MVIKATRGNTKLLTWTKRKRKNWFEVTPLETSKKNVETHPSELKKKIEYIFPTISGFYLKKKKLKV